jgi:site-specific DNA recombinase
MVIDGAVSEFERSMVRLRLRNGRRAKHERGGFAYGSPPFGLRSQHGNLVPDQREALAIARILELRAQGASLRTIAATLDREGHPTKRGGPWSAESLRRVLARATR